MKRLLRMVIIALLLVAGPRPVAAGQAAKLETLKLEDGGKLEFYLAKPGKKALERAAGKGGAPLLIALPMGGGGRREALGGMQLYWSAGPRHGYLVASPLVRGGKLHFREGREDIGPLLKHLKSRFKIDDRRIAVAGVSNGGNGAFTIAASYPGVFRAIMAMPGTCAVRGTELKKLMGVPMYLRVGARDQEGWRKGVAQVAARFKKLGNRVDFAEVADQGHVMRLPPAKLFAWLDQALAEKQAASKPAVAIKAGDKAKE